MGLSAVTMLRRRGSVRGWFESFVGGRRGELVGRGAAAAAARRPPGGGRDGRVRGGAHPRARAAAALAAQAPRRPRAGAAHQRE